MTDPLSSSGVPAAPPTVAAVAAEPAVPARENPAVDAPQPAAPQPAAAVSGPLPPASRWLLGGLLATLLLAVLALLLAWQASSDMHGLELDLVRRQQLSGEQAAEARMLAKQSQELVRDTAAKVALLETRLSEVALQRTQLEELIQSLSRSRDENLITDIDAAIRVALQQSAITGSAEPLVAALRSADERLARVSQPRLERVRRALVRDLERVRAVGVPEIGALLIKLDEAARLVDELPLLGDAQAIRRPDAARTAPAARPAGAAASSAGDWWAQQRDDWGRAGNRVWTELRQLLRVTRIDQPEAALIAPEQSVFLRENVKLRVLNARLALLSRQPEAAQGDLQMAASAVQRYFDGSARRTQVTLELLRQAAQQSRQVGVPRPDETLAAISAAVAGR
ncbi:MAG: uroporphyrinogen-III C-methyltransferase [Burkholderiales bacterium]